MKMNPRQGLRHTVHMVPGLLLLRTWYVFHYLQQHAHLREEQQLQEGSNGIQACPTWCGIGIDVCFADLDFSQMFRSFRYSRCLLSLPLLRHAWV